MFENVKKNFGFGCMRLPMLENGEVDYVEFSKMIDEFLAAGFKYFDTAHVYTDGKSEIAMRECLVKRYPREKFVFTNKLSNIFKTEADIRPLFQTQLDCCGLKYFDFYLMHAQNAKNFVHYKNCRAYEQAFELKSEGKIKHVGISFHDSAEVLEQILNEYPQIELVQIQLNYLDWDDPTVQSRKCYEVCRKYHKPVVVMEPVKGGTLANLPEEGKTVIENLNGGSAASYAIRFAAGLEGIFMVLSGMSNTRQMQDNLSFMTNFHKLNGTELAALEEIVNIFHKQKMIACTACRYCVAGCPKNISIPDLFACYNNRKLFRDWNANYFYHEVHTKNKGKASDCVRCGRCESSCPQKLPIRSLLKDVAEEFEKAQGENS